jgi:hypothetical protein
MMTVLVEVCTNVVGMTFVLVPLTSRSVVSTVWVDVAKLVLETVATRVVEMLKLEAFTPTRPFPRIELLLNPVPTGAATPVPDLGAVGNDLGAVGTGWLLVVPFRPTIRLIFIGTS